MKIKFTTGCNGHAGWPEVTTFLPDQLLQSASVELLVFKGEIKTFCCNRLVARTTKLGKERMRQSLIDCDTLFWMDVKHLAKYVESITGSFRELLSKCSWGLIRQFSQKTLGFLGGYKIHVFFSEFPEFVRDYIELERQKVRNFS